MMKHQKIIIFIAKYQQIVPYLLTNSRYHNRYGPSQWQTVYFVMLSLTGQAHPRMIGTYILVNKGQHYLKTSFNLAGSYPKWSLQTRTTAVIQPYTAYDQTVAAEIERAV